MPTLRESTTSLVQLVFLLATLLGIFPSVATAHELKPAIVNLNFSQGSNNSQTSLLSIDIVTNIESLIADIGPEHEDTDSSNNTILYKELRAMDERTLMNEFSSFQSKFISQIDITDSQNNSIPLTLYDVAIPETGDITVPRDTRITLQASLPRDTVALKWKWNQAFGEAIVRANSDSIVLEYAALLSPGQQSDLIQFTEVTKQSGWSVLQNYVVVGFEHILPKGLDHILFVIGVFLLTPAWRPIAIQVTIFTLAHSITLALSINGLLTVPSTIVEPLIALSILIICIENHLTDKLTKWRVVMVFVFGLLHGLGFASVLNDVGLNSQHFFIALLGFNVGVEIGQLLIIAICMLGIGIWFGKHHSYRTYFSKPASIVIGAIGLFWFIERISS